MTVHRDLDQLERAGRLRKVRGGAVPVEATPPRPMIVCVACYALLNPRTQVVLHMADGSQRRACCPHCGLMALRRGMESVTAFLVTDFLYRPGGQRADCHLRGSAQHCRVLHANRTGLRERSRRAALPDRIWRPYS